MSTGSPYAQAMLLLSRTVRFAINPAGAPLVTASGLNGYAGVPSMQGLGRHYELDVSCSGEIDPVVGYLINIKDIDRAVRERALPVIARACEDHDRADAVSVLAELFGPVDAALRGRVAAVRWWLSPYYSLEMARDSRDRVLMRQRFEFAASHRLHMPGLSAEENQRLFGKCNNPSGHGHNYIVEPCVEVAVGSERPFTLQDLERIVHQRVIERFDHMHLNVDRPEFAPIKGLNPSVENIAKVCYDLLAPSVKSEGHGAALRSVTVWETEKTSCTYPA